MKTESKSILQKMKELQDKTIADATLIKGGTMENCHPQNPPTGGGGGVIIIIDDIF
jgi:hypothetical protein